MKLAALFDRAEPVPFGPDHKIPWDDPAFSARVLREHLSQDHDRASRRMDRVADHVAWLHQTVLGGSRGRRVLDLGCGPGLYTLGLSGYGHYCLGVDFGPASIAYAVAEAARAEASCTYLEMDVRAGGYRAAAGVGNAPFDAALMLFGEPNTFTPVDLEALLTEVHGSLAVGGAVVLEVHTEAFVKEIGGRGPVWFTSARSVFAEAPHLCLRESFWFDEEAVAVERYHVISEGAEAPAVFTSTTQAYSDVAYNALFARCGFRVDPTRYTWPGGEGLEVWLLRRVS